MEKYIRQRPLGFVSYKVQNVSTQQSYKSAKTMTGTFHTVENMKRISVVIFFISLNGQSKKMPIENMT